MGVEYRLRKLELIRKRPTRYVVLNANLGEEQATIAAYQEMTPEAERADVHVITRPWSTNQSSPIPVASYDCVEVRHGRR